MCSVLQAPTPQGLSRLGYRSDADEQLHITQRFTYHPHLHSLLADGAWGKRDDAFQPIAWLDADILSSAFRQQVLAMMVSKRRLSAEFAKNISNWSHSGFHVHCGPPVEADQPQALERLAAYILRPSFASTRVRYLAGSGQVHYRTAKGVARSIDALDWIAQVGSHIPDPGEQMVRYYGWYSNASRGKRRKRGVSVPVEGEVPSAVVVLAWEILGREKQSWFERMFWKALFL